MHPYPAKFEPPELKEAPVRDRILMLGRRKAGKTVFLSRLYEQAWRGGQGLHMRAVDGALHEICMDMVDQLKEGLWPAATAGSLSSGVDVSWQGQHTTMVMLDYPGEVFRRAFVEGGGDEQSDNLIDHVDHAAAVILLIDPSNVHGGEASEVVDDDYGMVQAVERIRRVSGDDKVPIAVALTKCDEHLGIVQDAGGARGFVEKYLPNLVRYGGRMRMFATAAVRTRLDAVGRPIPNTQYEPAGLLDAVKYCMKHVGRQIEAAEQRRVETARLRQQHEAERLDRQVAQRSRQRWIGFWIGAAVLGLILVGLSVLVSAGAFKGASSPSEPPSPVEPVIADETPPVAEEPIEPPVMPESPSRHEAAIPRYPSAGTPP